MSRRGNCQDNAVAESSFNLLKRERIRRKTHRTGKWAGLVYRDRGSPHVVFPMPSIEINGMTHMLSHLTAPAASIFKY